ncbi:MAG: hypothetical protein KGO81_01785 [Bacteroidota bacterium]|nr:hypothetical protein [Bacteroidota bacterium]
MKKWISLFAAVILLACKEKKVDLSGDKPVKVNDFIAAFKPLALPFNAADTNINKLADSTLIGYKVLTQFIPDSSVNRIIHNASKADIHPIGRIEKQKEDYLLANFIHNKKTQMVAFVLDKKNKFLAAKEILSNTSNDGYYHSVNINKEPTFLLSREKLNADKQLMFTRIGWVYNTGNSFMVIINDGNEDAKKADEIIDPIDTFPKKNKYSGNYVQNKKNFISIRDGRNQQSYLFFIHFEKNDGTCIGELKGLMKLTSATTAIYSEGGDPCVIDFSFKGNEIHFKEKGSCGNRRGMQCFFNDTFVKKKEPKSSKRK